MQGKAGTHVVVTGMGAVSCVGTGVEDFWKSLIAGKYGIRRIARFNAESHRIPHAGEVDGFTLDPDGPDPSFQFLGVAGREAMAHADRGTAPVRRDRLGIVVATNFGAMAAAAGTVLLPEWRPEEPARGPSHGVRVPTFQSAADGLARLVDARGPRAVLSLSCASGNAALGYALDAIRCGRADAMLACGFDAISELVWSGLGALRTMTPNVLRPFDKRRDGTIFSEGAGALVLETRHSAESRGAVPLAHVLGHAMNNNSFHMTHPEKDGAGLARAMAGEPADGRVRPDQIDHVSAHGTATRYNDSIETRAIKNVLGDHARSVAVNSIKSMMGHAMGAASALEAVAVVMAMRQGIVPPTINYEDPDPECDLDYTPNRPVEREVRYALSNDAGIGGANSAVVFGRTV